MKKENYSFIILISTIITVVNYLTSFMFMSNHEIIIFIWTLLNIVVFPIWISIYCYRIAILKKQKNLIYSGLIAVISYLSTYFIPFIEYINFHTLSLSGDNLSILILKFFFLFGLIILLISLIIFHLKLRK